MLHVKKVNCDTIFEPLLWSDQKSNDSQIEIKSFIVFAVLRRSEQRPYGARFRVIAHGQHSFF